jgi:hypothetical protein
MTDKTDAVTHTPLQVTVNTYPTGMKAVAYGINLAIGICLGLNLVYVFAKVVWQIWEWFS